MQDRFPALRTISVLFKVLAWIIAVVGVIAGLLMLVLPQNMEGDGTARIVAFGITLLVTFFYWLFLYAIAEGIGVILAIEENTRRAANEMANLVRPPQTD